MINCSQFGFAAVAAERGEGGGQVAIPPPAFEIGGHGPPTFEQKVLFLFACRLVYWEMEGLPGP